MPFLVTEDRALKQKLQGLLVHDATAPPTGRKVVVRYKNPEYELADSVYPLILLSHTRISKDEEREARGVVQVQYAPEGYATWPDMADPSKSPYLAEMPIPLNIDYQVDAYCRKELHLIELIDQLITYHRLPHRFGYLAVPEDGTVRRLDLLGGPDFYESKDELGKRLFCATWAIRVSAEVFLYDILTLTPAQRVLIDFYDKAAWDAGHRVPLENTVTVTRTKLLIPPVVLPAATVGVPYRQALAAVNGRSPFTWSLGSGSALPPGLVFAPSGVLFGTPTAPTSAPAAFQVVVHDSDAPPQAADTTLTLTVRPAPLGADA
ncbi:Ig domain-containing protein [Streptomyces roseifaciens]